MANVENIFLQYLNIKNIAAISEDKHVFNLQLKEFWPFLRTIDGEEYKAFSLLTMRQSLRSALSKSMSLDIACDQEFKQSNDVFMNYVKSLKKCGKGCVTHYK